MPSRPVKASASRKASLRRETKETHLAVKLNLDGQGRFKGAIGIPFFEHMLNLWTRHSQFDLELSGAGDLDVDFHHTVEDVGIVLGTALREAAGSKEGIRRYGVAYVPMEETLARCVVDFCNRPYFRLQADVPKTKVGEFDAELGEEFMRALAMNAGLTLHIEVFYGSNVHHILEAVFKSVGLALGEACRRDARIAGVLSTKGTI